MDSSGWKLFQSYFQSTSTLAWVKKISIQVDRRQLVLISRLVLTLPVIRNLRCMDQESPTRNFFYILFRE